MNIIGILIGIAIIAGLILAIGKMSEQGVDINDHFCTGNCSECGSPESGPSCNQYSNLEQLHLKSGGKE